jgi:hypothetical protein
LSRNDPDPVSAEESFICNVPLTTKLPRVPADDPHVKPLLSKTTLAFVVTVSKIFVAMEKFVPSVTTCVPDPVKLSENGPVEPLSVMLLPAVTIISPPRLIIPDP